MQNTNTNDIFQDTINLFSLYMDYVIRKGEVSENTFSEFIGSIPYDFMNNSNITAIIEQMIKIERQHDFLISLYKARVKSLEKQKQYGDKIIIDKIEKQKRIIKELEAQQTKQEEKMMQQREEESDGPKP